MNELKYESLEELDEQTDKLINKYILVYAYILRRLQQQINQGLNTQQAQQLLQRINNRLSKLDKDTLRYVKNVFPQYYLLGLNNLDKQLLQVDGVKIIEGAEHAIHKQALHKAQNDLYRDLAKRTTYMSNEAKKIIRNNSQQLLTAMIESGESYKSVKKELRKKLTEQGISSFTDVGRKQWTIDRYSDMLIRTKSRILHNEGTINRLKEYQEDSTAYNENFDLIQISEHGADDWCSFYEGKVYSLSGRHEYYPSIETLPNRPYEILHPNCRHVWLPYVPSLRGQGKRVESKYQNMTLSELNKLEYQMNKAR